MRVVRAVIAVLASLVVAVVAVLAQPSSAQPPAHLSAAQAACPVGQVQPGPITQVPGTDDVWSTSNLVVDGSGRITTGFQLTHGVNPNVSELWSGDVPASSGDPRLIRSGSEPDSPAIAGRRTLGIDAAGIQTFAWREATPGGLANVMVATRSPGGAWSAPVIVNQGPGPVGGLALAVNAAGAAVVTWLRGLDSVVGAYRPAGSATWLPPTYLVRHVGVSEVGIDDAGIATMVYVSPEAVPRDRAAVRVRRFRPTAGWGPARKISVGTHPHPSFVGLGVSPNGAATVTWEQFNPSVPNYLHFNRRMTPAGRWLPVVRRRGNDSFARSALAIDGRGIAVVAWWRYPDDVVAQTGRRDGTWRRPVVIAKNQPDAYRSRLQVAMNRRGDTFVSWQLSIDLPRLWGRYRPVGGAWAPAQRLKPRGEDQIAPWATAIGADGTAAISWIGVSVTGVQARQLTVC